MRATWNILTMVALMGAGPAAAATAKEAALGTLGNRPEAMTASDTRYYGVGAFLLVADAIDALDGAPRR